MLNSILDNSASSSIELSILLLCFIVSIVLGIVIALTHKKTSKYSKNFLITVSLLPLMVNAVMLMVNGNLGTSIAIMGAFSLVRFRSIPGTSKEILTVFFAMAVGLATGMGQLGFAVILTILGSGMIIFLNKVELFDKDKGEKVLKITIPENLDYSSIFDEEFNEYTISHILEKTKTTNMGSMFELTYKVILKKDIKEKEFIDKLRIKNGNLKISLDRETNEIDL